MIDPVDAFLEIMVERTARSARQPPAGVNSSRSLKRTRRTKAEMNAIRDAIFAELKETHPQTVRHVFYRMTTLDVVPKQEKLGYQTVKNQLLNMRKNGRVPWQWIADDTRWQRKPTSYGSLEEALKRTAEFYRRDIWQQAEHYVEVWCESDSIAGIIMEVTAEYDVPLMVSRGFSSATYLWRAAQYIARVGKPAHLYYFGDWDPSGKIIPKVIERELRRHAPNAEIHFERIAITPKQIEDLGLPAKPPKTSTHSKGFKGGTVEIEAMPVPVLLDLVRGCIEQHIDQRQRDVLKVAEESERDILVGMLGELREGYWDGAGGEQ